MAGTRKPRPSSFRRAWPAIRVLIVTAILAPAAIATAYYGDPRTVEGLAVDGVPLPRTREAWPLLKGQADAWLDTKITIDASVLVVSATRRELGARIDLHRLVRKVHATGRTGNPVADWEQRQEARLGRLDHRLPVRVDRSATVGFVRQLRERIDHLQATMARQSEVPAREVAESEVIADLGPPLDVLVLLELYESAGVLEEALVQGENVVVLPATVLELPELPPIGETDDPFGAVLASHETEFHRVAAGRRANIEEAADRIGGTVLQPGERFSYNAVLGERTFENGYRPATEIANGRIVEGIGGGICQVAGTLHAAAFLSGLPVRQHHHHSRASSYIDLGLDAMVSWPDKDLVFDNDLPFPIRIDATARDGVVRVELRGLHRLRSVSYRTRVVERTDRRTRREEVDELATGVEEVVREGDDGYILSRTRVVRTRSGTSVEEERLVYPPVDRLVRIGR